MDMILVAGSGLIVGLIAGYFLARVSRDKTARADAARELEDYREKVAEHFATTARAVNRMTDSYREVFEELQSGAQNLIGEERLRELLADESGHTVTIKRIGYQQETKATPATPATTPAGKAAQEKADDARASQDSSEPETVKVPAVTEADIAGKAADEAKPTDSAKSSGKPEAKATKSEGGAGKGQPTAAAAGEKARGKPESEGKTDDKGTDSAAAKPAAGTGAAATSDSASKAAGAELGDTDLSQVPKKTNGNGAATPRPKP